MEKAESDHKLELANKELEHVNRIQPLESEISDLKRQINEKEVKFKNEEKIKDKTHELITTTIKHETQPILQKLESLTKEKKDEIDIKQLMHDSEKRILDAQKALMVNEFRKSTQDELNPLIQQNEALERQLELSNQIMKEVKELKQEKHKKEMLEHQAKYQNENNQLQLDSIDKENDISLNQGKFDEEAKRRKLETQNKKLEQRLDPRTKQKYEKELQKEELKTSKLEKRNKLVQKVADARNENEEMRQDVLMQLTRLDSSVKPEDIDNDEKFN